MASPGTRLNSLVLFVTRMKPLARAMPAMSRSCGPNQLALGRQVGPDLSRLLGRRVVERQRHELGSEPGDKCQGRALMRRSAVEGTVDQLGQDDRTEVHASRSRRHNRLRRLGRDSAPEVVNEGVGVEQMAHESGSRSSY